MEMEGVILKNMKEAERRMKEDGKHPYDFILWNGKGNPYGWTVTGVPIGVTSKKILAILSGRRMQP